MAAVVRPWVPRDVVSLYLGVQAYGEENLNAIRLSNLYGNPRLADRTVESMQLKLNRDRELFDGPVPENWDQPVPYSRWISDEVSALYSGVLKHNGVCDLIKGNQRFGRFLLARSVSAMRLKLWSDRRVLWFQFLRQQYEAHHFNLAHQMNLPPPPDPQQEAAQQQDPAPQQQAPQPNFAEILQHINHNIDIGFAAVNNRMDTLEQRINTALNNLR